MTELVTAPCAAALLDPELARAAPGRVLTTPARRSPQPSGDVQQRLYADLIRRYEGARTFDLVERRIPDRP
ncbi:hypothetical protein OJ963_24425 [Streptomyces sp. RS2]|uniref:hypothetical protein n=1 Tax=Streptomyces sp. RS2 TaxID=1451205 RepID=UPI0021F880DB|nr:hypothetical protein [Streptomyces sp. RS2]MCW1097018.1 hypothetical protein [Streptomyces sp. RS2]